MTPNLAVVAEDFSEPISLWPLVGLEPSPPLRIVANFLPDSLVLPLMFGGKEWGTVGSGIKWQVVGNKRKLQEWQRGVLRILGMGIVLSRGRVLSQGGQIMMWYPSWAKSEVGHLFLLCLKPACTQFVNHFFLDSQRERSYKIALVCLSVCNENQLCQFSQFWFQRFF